MRDSAVRALFEVDGRPRLQRAVRALVGVTLVANLAYVMSLLVAHRPSSGYDTLWDGWLYHVATGLPAVLAALAAVVDRRSRVGWWLISGGITLNLAGNLIYTYHDQNLSPVPYPAWSDVAYLGSYVAFVVALVLVTQRQTGDTSKAVRLDGLVIGLGSAAVAVGLWFEPILAQSGSTAAVLVGMAYPLFDVVFIVVVISGLAPARFRPTWSAACFMAGALVFAVGDVIYLNQLSADTYRNATLLEMTWPVGILLFGLAPWFNQTGRRDREMAPAAAIVPGIAATLALGVIGFGIGGRVPPLAAVLAMAAIAVVLVRVGLTVRELRRANEAFAQARTDDLTTLFNRRGFSEGLDRRLESGPTSLAVMMIDLNGFKEVNDSLGHHAGDRLLAVVAERFTRALPAGSLLARLGGDEFGIALSGDRASVEAAADAIQRCLDQPVALEGIAIRIGASIGLASTPDHGTSREELLRAADVAMYDAKTNQLGSAWYSVDHDPHSRDRLALIEDLRNAIDQRAFEMHYQPTVNVATGEVVGMEALIRWNHPQRGMMAPDEFIPLAERVGLIPAITRAVLDLSIAHLADTIRNGHDLRLSINISAMDLVDDSLVDYIRATLHANQVAAELITLEITETAVSADSVRAERTLNALRAIGIRISIDDFGVGYSSMSQLLQLPLDELKLDRSFIANLDNDVRAQAILAATVELGRTLGLDIVAEGIETGAALDEVGERGVDTAQGFYFSKALPPEAFEHFVFNARAPYGTTNEPARSGSRTG